VMRLNAQYGSMVRTSLSVHARLMRVQALRQKREAIEGAANEDAWTQHVAERSMLWVVDPAARPLEAAPVEAVPVEAMPVEAMPVEATAACVDQKIEEDVSDDGIESHDAAFETWLSEQPWYHGSRGSGKPNPRQAVREAMTGSRLAGQELPANGRESPRRADERGHIDREMASA
jgi:hypothetical protein